jgi:hypothetical protein
MENSGAAVNANGSLITGAGYGVVLGYGGQIVLIESGGWATGTADVRSGSGIAPDGGVTASATLINAQPGHVAHDTLGDYVRVQ